MGVIAALSENFRRETRASTFYNTLTYSKTLLVCAALRALQHSKTLCLLVAFASSRICGIGEHSWGASSRVLSQLSSNRAVLPATRSLALTQRLTLNASWTCAGHGLKRALLHVGIAQNVLTPAAVSNDHTVPRTQRNTFSTLPAQGRGRGRTPAGPGEARMTRNRQIIW